MNVFSRVKSTTARLTGVQDTELMKFGLLAHGTIVSISPDHDGRTLLKGGLNAEGMRETTCAIRMQIVCDGGVPYMATTYQRVPDTHRATLGTGRATCAVWVDPSNPGRFTADLNRSAPCVRMGRPATGPASADWIAENGRPVQVRILTSRQLGFCDYRGRAMHLIGMTVFDPECKPYLIEVGNPVSSDGLRGLYPGSLLPAKLGHQSDDVLVDFEAEQLAGG